MRIDTIALDNVLPDVFASAAGDASAVDSDVWLCGVTFNRPGIYRIEAESGTGKSSMCSFIYGNRSDYRGRILFNGRDIRSFSVKEWCDMRVSHIALLPQEMRLFPELTETENIEIKNRLTSFKTRDEITAMLERLEIADKADEPAARLSIGQQQRVAIVRSLCQPFDFLLLDEPVSHLDARNNSLVSQLILDEVNRQGAAVIATSVGYAIDIDPVKVLSL